MADAKGTIYLNYELPDARQGLPQTSKGAGVACNMTSLELKEQAESGNAPDYKGRGPPHLHVAMAAILRGVGKIFGEQSNKDE
eukprot:3026749-Pyramimonas_sp.AAC.1